MDDMVEWLRAQLADDERVIRDAAEDYFYGDGHGQAVRRWFDRWSPDNPEPMLAEIEAKRLMLDFLDPTDAPEGEGKYVAKRAILLLAQPYAGYPGWREEWSE